MTADARPESNGTKKERLVRRSVDMLLDELAALFQEDQIHFFHRKIGRYQAFAAIFAILSSSSDLHNPRAEYFKSR